ncbi:hypothetical protein Taro_030883 [Colocasia esculenta]|uniref:Uncharacterized protein n=1 Tax=Colocasia esculenta TaxID=4460 RepID=A0A843VZ72_COLES|nr:hypothetical protein [Colocasia esculenta]
MRGARAIRNFPPEVQVSRRDGGGSAIRVDFKKEDATGPGPLGRTQPPSDGFCDGVELPQRRSDCEDELLIISSLAQEDDLRLRGVDAILIISSLAQEDELPDDGEEGGDAAAAAHQEAQGEAEAEAVLVVVEEQEPMADLGGRRWW